MTRQVSPYVTDLMPVEFTHSYTFDTAGDGDPHSLAELDGGYFTTAIDPANSDRAVRFVEVRVDEAETNPLYLGGPQGQEFKVLPGESYGQEASWLSQIYYRDNSQVLTLYVTFRAMDA